MQWKGTVRSCSKNESSKRMLVAERCCTDEFHASTRVVSADLESFLTAIHQRMFANSETSATAADSRDRRLLQK